MAIPFVTAEPLFKIRIEEPPTTRSLATQRPETAPFDSRYHCPLESAPR